MFVDIDILLLLQEFRICPALSRCFMLRSSFHGAQSVWNDPLRHCEFRFHVL